MTGVMDLSTKIEVDEPEESDDADVDRNGNLNLGIGTTVAEELRKELREAEKEIERVRLMCFLLRTMLDDMLCVIGLLLPLLC